MCGRRLRLAFAEPLDGGKTRLPQRLFLGAELLEDLADLPIGGMNEFHDNPPCHRNS